MGQIIFLNKILHVDPQTASEHRKIQDEINSIRAGVFNACRNKTRGEAALNWIKFHKAFRDKWRIIKTEKINDSDIVTTEHKITHRHWAN
jgi:hypothetical protein